LLVRTTIPTTEQLAAGGQRRTVVAPDGTETVSVIGPTA
jgi:hypothetical protein